MAILKPKVPGDRGNPFTHTGIQKPSGAIPSDLNIPRQVSNVGRWLPYVGDFFEQQHIVSNPRLTAQQKQKQLGEMVPYQMLDLINPVASVIPKGAIRKVATSLKDLVPTSPIRWGYGTDFAGAMGTYGQYILPDSSKYIKSGMPMEIAKPRHTNPDNMAAMIAMLPEHFRKLNPPRPSVIGGKVLTRDEYLKAIEPTLDAMRQGKQFTGTYDTPHSGFAPPVLNVEWDDLFKRWQILGHEGRGRALMAEQVAPDQLIPVDLFMQRYPVDSILAGRTTDFGFQNPGGFRQYWQKGRTYAPIAADDNRLSSVGTINPDRWWDDAWFGRGGEIPEDALSDYIHTRHGLDTPTFWEQLGFDASRVRPDHWSYGTGQKLRQAGWKYGELTPDEIARRSGDPHSYMTHATIPHGW